MSLFECSSRGLSTRRRVVEANVHRIRSSFPYGPRVAQTMGARVSDRSALRIILNVLREPMLALLMLGSLIYLLLRNLAEAVGEDRP